MKIYYFDEKGLFLYEDDAELDPAEWQLNHKKAYMIPEFATKIKPPKTGENQTTLFNGKNWEIVADYREQYICDAQMNLIYVSDVGELPEGYIPITAEQAAEIEADKFKYIIKDSELIENPNYEEIKRQKHRQELDRLTLTPADVERALYYSELKMDFDDLKAFIHEKLPELDIKGLGIEFRAKDFYRGAEANGIRLFDVIGALLGYTPADMDYLFENKVLPQKDENNE